MSLEEIRARVEAATPGPWSSSITGGIVSDIGFVSSNVRRGNDAEFIAAARMDVPKLVAALEAVLDAHREIQCLNEDGEETGATACANCKDHDDLSGERVHEVWPCFTVKEIQRAMTGQRTMADLRQSFIEALS